MHTHDTVMWAIQTMQRQTADFQVHDRFLNSLPMFHSRSADTEPVRGGPGG